jgi:hypothetical protein
MLIAIITFWASSYRQLWLQKLNLKISEKRAEGLYVQITYNKSFKPSDKETIQI